ncbi:hypothetical protein Pst134EB_022107 [Puccinia striiformis f. sp. tritici]|nr:hypothetical protein Pst134EB_022107 [Puccinia striiformis f. sp. tritici]
MDAWDADVLDAQFNSHRVPFRPPAIADIPENQQLRQQADVVIEGFRRLIAQCEFHSPSTPVDLDIDRLRSKRGLLTELSSRLLPLLDHQISSLLIPALNRSSLRTDTAPNLRSFWSCNRKSVRLWIKRYVRWMTSFLDEYPSQTKRMTNTSKSSKLLEFMD